MSGPNPTSPTWMGDTLRRPGSGQVIRRPSSSSVFSSRRTCVRLLDPCRQLCKRSCCWPRRRGRLVDSPKRQCSCAGRLIRRASSLASQPGAGLHRGCFPDAATDWRAPCRQSPRSAAGLTDAPQSLATTTTHEPLFAPQPAGHRPFRTNAGGGRLMIEVALATRLRSGSHLSPATP